MRVCTACARVCMQCCNSSESDCVCAEMVCAWWWSSMRTAPAANGIRRSAPMRHLHPRCIMRQVGHSIERGVDANDEQRNGAQHPSKHHVSHLLPRRCRRVCISTTVSPGHADGITNATPRHVFPGSDGDVSVGQLYGPGGPSHVKLCSLSSRHVGLHAVGSNGTASMQSCQISTRSQAMTHELCVW